MYKTRQLIVTKHRQLILTTFYTISIVILNGLLSGCKLVLLQPRGLIASQEKHILIISAALMLLIVLPVIFLTLFFSWRYKESNKKARYQPEWAHSTLLEVICWSVPCAIIIILGAITWTSSHQLDPYKPLASNNNQPIIIQAIALQWKWLFIYPEQNIATINYLQFPANVPIKFIITADGPMNSFQIPQLGGQIYAMAGMQTKLHLIADSIGDYEGMSANFSGNGFSNMKFIAHATSQPEFELWVKSVKQSSGTLSIAEYNKLIQPSEDNAIQYFSLINKNIFNIASMKNMIPANEIEKLCKDESFN